MLIWMQIFILFLYFWYARISDNLLVYCIDIKKRVCNVIKLNQKKHMELKVQV